MALDDDTRVTFTIPTGATVNFVDQPTSTAPFTNPIDLDEYESVVIAVHLNDLGGGTANEIIGTRVQTSDATGGSERREAVINVGSWHGSNNATGSARDIGFDQILPVDYLGTQFVMGRGAETTPALVLQHENPTVVAHSDNTSVFINGSVTPVGTIDAGEFLNLGPFDPFDSAGVLKDVIFVETSEPAYMYQSSNSAGAFGQGLNFIPAVFPNLETQDVVLPDVGVFGGDAVTTDLDLIIEAGGTITVTGGGCPPVGPSAIEGTSDFETYKLSSCTGDIDITSPSGSTFFTSMAVAASPVGAAGYFTGFPNSYAIQDFVTVGKKHVYRSRCNCKRHQRIFRL